nr:MAG TPA_asm: hypothetical protein [Microviridae sp.]
MSKSIKIISKSRMLLRSLFFLRILRSMRERKFLLKCPYDKAFLFS